MHTLICVPHVLIAGVYFLPPSPSSWKWIVSLCSLGMELMKGATKLGIWIPSAAAMSPIRRPPAVETERFLTDLEKKGKGKDKETG